MTESALLTGMDAQHADFLLLNWEALRHPHSALAALHLLDFAMLWLSRFIHCFAFACSS